jgi:hypothetical protein
MAVRILDASASDFAKMNGSDLAESIASAEGRTVGAEVICNYESPVEGVSQGEICSVMGADIIVLDRYDCNAPVIKGAPDEVVNSSTPLSSYGKMLGRPVGVNIISASPETAEKKTGQYYTEKNFATLVEQGVDLVFVYAIAQDGGTLSSQLETIKEIRRTYGDKIMVVGVPFYTQLPAPTDSDSYAKHESAIKSLIDAGSHMVGIAMPGTSQSWRVEQAAKLTDAAHAQGGLVWSFITGSVEGAPEGVMHRLAVDNKMMGVDAVRVDEAGLSGMPLPESVREFSFALRGKRHTYRRMALSPLR